MRKILHILPLLAAVLALFSCGNDGDQYAMFGKTQAYESWWLDEYVPQRMERYLDLEWNDASKKLLNGKPIKIAVYTLDDDGYEEPATDVLVYKNDELCDDNTFKVYTTETEVKFALEFKKEAKEGEHLYFPKYQPIGGRMDVLDEVAFEKFGADNRVMAEKEVIMNPLKKAVTTGSTAFLILCIAWYILSRFIIWKSTPFSKVTITYVMDNVTSEYVVKMRGGFELVCTSNKKNKDSLFCKIFKGSRAYEYHEFWQYPVILGRGSRRNSISISGKRHYSVDGEMERRLPIVFINENGDKATIQTS